ncbi:MAG: hypothetical protein KBT35_08735 [Firmicutes bacterium]|nr:hypothetical protein [Candidatus Colivicinus equi]
MTNTKKANNEVINYLILVVLAFLFLLVFSNGTSPLTKHYYGSDSAFFMFFGKAMKNGMIPYVDVFDHKGPYFFFTQELGQIICEGRYGAFIIQIINLSISMFIVDKIILKARPNLEFKKRIIFQIPLAWLLIVTFRDGNMTEEYALPHLFLSLLLFIKSLDLYNDEGYYHNPKYALIYGFSLGVLALSRITNAAFLCAVVLTITILLIYKKEYKNLTQNIVCFVSGLILSFIPIIIYFISVNGLEYMLKYVFVFAYKYSMNSSLGYRISTYFTLKNILFILPAFLPVLYLILINKMKTKEFVFACIGFIATFIATFLGFSFTHYFVLAIPNVSYGIYLCLKYFDLTEKLYKNKVIVIATIIFVMLQGIYVVEASGKNVLQIADYSLSEKQSNYYENLEKLDLEIGEIIPQEDKNKVWGYGIKARLYLRTDMYPCVKFFDYLDQFLSYDDLREEIISLYNINRPKWLIISKEKETIPKFLEESIESDFYLSFENERYSLYKRK